MTAGKQTDGRAEAAAAATAAVPATSSQQEQLLLLPKMMATMTMASLRSTRPQATDVVAKEANKPA